MNIQNLKEKRSALLSQQEAVFSTAKKENRNLNADEKQQFDRIESDLVELRGDIDRLEKLKANLEASEARNLETPKSVALDYSKTFGKYLRNHRLNAEERALLETRGTEEQVVGTDNLGGFTVPQDFSDTLEETMKQFGGMMQVSRIIRTEGGNRLPFPTVDDTANLGGLLAETASDTVLDMTFGVKNLDAYMYTSGILQVSTELLKDNGVNLEQFVGGALAKRVGRAINAHLTTGTGTSQPNGLVTAASSVDSASNAGITRADILNLIHAVDPAYRGQGKLMFNDATFAAIKQLSFGTGDARPLFYAGNPSTGMAATIEGFEYVINQDMPSIAADTKGVIAFGDFDKYLVRMAGTPQISVSSEFAWDKRVVSYVMFQRVDGELLQDEAIKVLKVIA